MVHTKSRSRGNVKRSRKCPYGMKKDGGCKKKSGRFQSFPWHPSRSHQIAQNSKIRHPYHAGWTKFPSLLFAWPKTKSAQIVAFVDNYLIRADWKIQKHAIHTTQGALNFLLVSRHKVGVWSLSLFSYKLFSNSFPSPNIQ